ncbi:MAG: C40 family peptidase [Bacteroidales bacterium]|nr:C40 family peptidase [Bacteroidales bacterium]MDT8372366.1 C40 family peptidase [Bacteroidales bacterium]
MISLTPGRTLSILLLAACQLMITSCSKRVWPETSPASIESPAERKKLNEFMDAGVEKPLNTGSTTADEVINTARKYLGVPHCMGGKTMKCIDCSGLLAVVFASHGMQLPHNSEEQARYGKIIAERKNLKNGDLVFFIKTYNTSRFITHSSIYLGEKKFIHTSTSLGVTITSLDDPWWTGKYLFGTRIFH